MRVVADTNIVVSGLLWGGAPREVLNLARSGEIQLFASGALILELSDVVQREKFRRRFELAGVEPNELVYGYAALARLVEPPEVRRIITEDPDDDVVLACALAADAAFIISGDRHLLQLEEYEGIRIRTARQFLDRPRHQP